MPALFVLGSIILPAILGLQVLLVPNRASRNLAIFMTCLVLIVCSLGMWYWSPFQVEFNGTFGGVINLVIAIGDILVLVFMAYLGWQGRRPWVVLLALIQLFFFGWLELFIPGLATEGILVDRLTLTLNFIVTVVGSLVIIFAVKYMDDMEAEPHLSHRGLPRFFAVLIFFLSAMNGLVSTGNLRWLYFFWEITTLASFLLISHFKHQEATENAFRALWMNQLGGVAILLALVVLGRELGTASLTQLILFTPGNSRLLLVCGLLAFAAFVKAAQLPFHGWLLGAMVAPTPVSALLHSSTMVNAALYLVFRLSPAIRGTSLGSLIAVYGTFSFLTASAMAIGEENAKRVLAFSTIANLGLALAMGSLNTPLALTAGLLILVYHALSKGLLFLAVGSIEHSIGTRHIEKMDRLFEIMPATTVLAVLGMISMMMPPFGMLVGKWLAIEAAVNNPVILLFTIFGSAFTVAFWSKWVGRILTTSCLTNGAQIKMESLSIFTGLPLYLLAGLVLLSSFFLAPVFHFFARPVVEAQFGPIALKTASGGLLTPLGGFFPWPVFAVLALVFLTMPVLRSALRQRNIQCSYLCGENTPDEEGRQFYSSRDQAYTAQVGNYYAAGVFGEGSVNRWAVPIAIGLLLLMLGVIW